MLRFLRISISTILGVLPFILFLLLAALMIFVLGEVRRLDLHYTRQKALQDNFQCIKSLEDEILSTRKNLEARLLQISEIREYADLVEFQKNYNEVNHKLMQEFLIEKEYERFRQKKAGIVPPIQIYPYKQRQTPFLETLSSLNDLFTTSPKIREHEKPKESTIFPKLAVSGVSLIVDKNRLESFTVLNTEIHSMPRFVGVLMNRSA